MVYALDAVLHEFPDFVGRDGPAAAAEHAYVARVQLRQAIDHVTEELVVTALVGAHRDSVGIFLHRRAHDVIHASIMAEMNHLSALRLYEAPHDVDRRVVPIEEGRRSDETQRRIADLPGRASQIARNRAHGSPSSGAKNGVRFRQKGRNAF
jgi:hypothetical protein